MSRSTTPPELVFTLGFASGLLALATVRLFLPGGRDPDLDLFRAVRDLAVETSVEKPEPRALVDDGLRGMIGSLDRYSRYYAGDEIAAIDRETSGEYLGIGVLFLDPDAGLVRFALPDSPAERAGVAPGDRIVSVDGERVADLAPGGLRERLQRATDRPIELELESRTGERRSTSLRPARVVDPTVRHARILDEGRGIGYAALSSFSEHTPEELDRELERLAAAGMRGLVLDLRGNPGGILDSAVRVANRFVADGVLVSTRSRTETRSSRADEADARWLGLPLVVLVDGDSASASEVLCGALQDHRAAVVVGEPTYGKGAVQTLSRFEHHGAWVKITTSSYFPPAGRRIERGTDWGGLAPDVLVPLAAGDRRAVHGFLAAYSPPPLALEALRRWEAEEGREVLERPPPDAQLDAALRLLTGEPPGPAALQHG
jgi:carboxyl-terminal processing protease